MKIESTSDYSKFKTILSNRVVKKRHVQELIHSFEEFPDLASAIPLIVNQDFYIIDGQHRFEVNQALGRPVYYVTIQTDDPVRIAQLLNSTHNAWTVMDFAYSYAQSGNWNYKKLLELYEEYPIAISSLMVFASNSQRRGMHEKFRSGKFKIFDNFAIVKDKLEKMEDFSDFRNWQSYAFSLAAYRVISTDGYDHKRMMKKLDDVKLTKQAGTVEYLRQIEEIYNRNVQFENHLRFYGV